MYSTSHVELIMALYVSATNHEINDIVILIHETLVEHTLINSAEKLGRPTFYYLEM